MRRLVLIVLLALAACGEGGGGGATSTTAPTTVERDRPLPAEVQSFLDRVDADAMFTATYRVLQRAGGTTADVSVDTATRTITSGDLTVELPASTDEEAALAALGIFSTFYAAGPAAQIEALARRADAEDPIFESRSVLGVALDCVRVPVQGATASQWCLTPEGVFGFVSTPSVQYELTSYVPAPTAG